MWVAASRGWIQASAFLECSSLSWYHTILVARCSLNVCFFIFSTLPKLLTPPGTVVWFQMSNSLFPSPRQQKKQSTLLASSRLFALLFTVSVFVLGNGRLCTWIVLLCLFRKVRNDSVCLSASVVDAVQMCCLVAYECCYSSTCSTAREDCRPLLELFSNVLSLCAQTVVICRNDLHHTQTSTSGRYSTCSQDQLMTSFSHRTPQNSLNCLLSSPLKQSVKKEPSAALSPAVS